MNFFNEIKQIEKDLESLVFITNNHKEFKKNKSYNKDYLSGFRSKISDNVDETNEFLKGVKNYDHKRIKDLAITTDSIEEAMRIFFNLVEYHKVCIDDFEELALSLFKLILNFLSSLNQSKITKTLMEISEDSSFVNFYSELYNLYIESIEESMIFMVNKYENYKTKF
ncbi:hypothetical protein A0H76_2658 [Hepatospora eriocheir]|uniref:Uncharacterized protein n=1 Tax=Hepatospora eriocheir TaxID=1081669 RepID=A0A1X0QJI5_9MICR|nr:hypothetical protein A0H76_2658 [Hepatospora eriocheir]